MSKFSCSTIKKKSKVIGSYTHDTQNSEIDKSKHVIEHLDNQDICTCHIGKCKLTQICKRKNNVIALLNIRSLYPKIDQLKYFLKQHPLDFLCINETWLNDTIGNADIKIDGYNIVRRDRKIKTSSTESNKPPKKSYGGGVLIYVKDNYSYKVRNDLVTDDIECLWIEVKIPGSNPFLINTCYRPPSANKEYNTSITSSIERACLEDKEMHILGDFNIDYNANKVSLIKDLETIHDLSQLVNFDTRITQTTSTCIDLILSSNPKRHIRTEPFKINLSDHYMVFTVIDTKFKQKMLNHKYATFRAYKNFNENAFINEVQNSFDNVDFSNDDVYVAWDKWKSKFLNLCDKHAPLRKMRVRKKHLPWVDREVLEKIYERDFTHKKAVSNKNEEDWSQYKKIRNEVTNLIKLKKKEYFTSKLKSAKNSKEMWNTIKEIIPDKKNNNSIPPEMNADSFNEYFSQIGLSLAKQHANIDIKWKNPDILYKFKFKLVSCDRIQKKLKQLPSTSNLDILGLDTKLLHIAADYLCESLTVIINLSLASGLVPDDWKLARVTPVYKGEGDILNESNYRPISVIGHIVKLTESEVKDQLVNYLEEHHLLTVDQSAYLKNHSTTTCLHKVIGEWQELIDDGEMIGACFLDISKCFDSIDHKILGTKLQKYGIKDNELNWFDNYLSGRTQKVICNNQLSKTCKMSIGVPQGSILGPILFLLFINDLTQFSGLSHCNLFADDALFYVHGRDIESINSKLQNSIESIADWYKRNKLSLNVKKSNVMIIHRKKNVQDTIDVTINQNKLMQIDHVKYLGLHIDSKLQWQHHVNNMCKVLNNKLAMFKRTAMFVDKQTMIQIYKSFIMPSFDYADTVWHGCSKFLEHKLQTLQNRAARIIEQNFDFIHTRGIDLLNKLTLQTTVERRNFRTCALMFKCIHGKVPTYLSDQIIMACDVHAYGTRQANSMNVYIQHVKTDCLRKSLFHTGGRLWNELPDVVKESENIDSFKRNYKLLTKKR